MFTATDFRLIFKNCPDKFDIFLKTLDITPPHFSGGDEFKLYSQLDDQITDKLNKLMGSESVIGGYIDLLELGNINANYSETDNMLLEKIVDNAEFIKKCTKNKERELSAVKTTYKDVVKYDFSGVKCNIRKNIYDFKIKQRSASYNRLIEDNNELACKIRDIICDYYLERSQGISSIDVSLSFTEKPPYTVVREKIPQTEKSLQSSALIKSIDKILSTLKDLNEIIKSIEK